jgi:hypothetical protein
MKEEGKSFLLQGYFSFFIVKPRTPSPTASYPSKESPTKASECEGNKKFCVSNNLGAGGHE